MTVHNVLDYGADPTDGSSDTGAIQKALDAATPGDTVYVPAVPDPSTDYYDITLTGGETGINIDDSHSGITLEGDGYDSVLRMEGGLGDNYRMIVVDEDNGNRITDVTIRGLRLDGNGSRQSTQNGIGLAFYLDDDSNDDSNLLVEWVWAHGFTNTGIAVTRGALCRYCTSYDNGKHGFAPKGGGPGHRTVVEYCLAHGNGLYGGDQHGYGVIRDCYFHDNGYGFKWSGRWDPPNNPVSKRIVAVNNDHIGFQMTAEISEGVIEDVYIDGTGSWGYYFQKGGNVRIRGDGLHARNVGKMGYRFGDVQVVDESSTSVIRLEGAGGQAVANEDGSWGNVDDLRWNSADGDVFQGGGSVTFDTIRQTSNVGSISTLPAKSEVGAEAYPGADSPTEEPAEEPEPSGSPMALVTNGGYPVATTSHPYTAGASTPSPSEPSGAMVIADFENLSDLSATFDYGNRGVISTDANYEDGGSRSLAVGGSGGGYEEMVATPGASSPLPAFFAKGEVARYYVRANADAGYSGAIFGAASDDDFYSASILWDTNGVRIFKKDGGTFTNIVTDRYLGGIGDVNRWYEIRVVRDDGTLGGANDDITVEVRDPSTAEVLWSHTFNDSTHASNVGVGLHTNKFELSGEYTYLDNIVKES